MPEPEIPNLLDSLRSGRRVNLGRGRGRGGSSRGGRGGVHGSSSISHDAVIQGTDTDAAVSRLSAVQIGYLDDPYASLFVTNADGPAPRRLPIINRGTYTRTTALDILIDSFLEDMSSQEKQIVSLGAGTDTRPFRLFNEQSRTRLIYHEVDFETTCRKKLHIVQTRPQVNKILGQVSTEDDSASWSSKPAAGGAYYCHGLDLRSLCVAKTIPEPPQMPGPELEPPEPADAPPPPSVVLPGLRTDIPTLLLSECCLCYLSPLDASNVLAYFTSRIQNLATVIYEPIKPSDAFGQMMVSNLAARRIRMPTLSVYREAADQVARLRHAGFETVENMTIEAIWKSWVEPEEKRRLDMLEGLDEVEEWELLAGHYIVVWGSRGDGFSRWRSLGKRS